MTHELDLGESRVLVAGLGVTGTAVVEVLRIRAAEVLSLDAKSPEATFTNDAEVDLGEIDLIVASPGWSPMRPLFVQAMEQGIPIWSEVELAWRLRVDRTLPGAVGPAPWLAVTGTNGKTTTVGMLTSILEADGRRVAEVGNVGTPVLLAALDPQIEVLAVELSSFQLHFTHSMSALGAAVLNLAHDHIDWHGSYEDYVRDKGRALHEVTGACIFNVEDVATRRLVELADVSEGARAVGFTLSAPGRGELGVVEDVLCDRAFHLPDDHPGRNSSADEIGTLADLGHLAGSDGRIPSHVLANALAAAALARVYGVSTEAVGKGLRAFRGGAHRSQKVAHLLTTDGPVALVDDSKATNAHAAAAALGSFTPGTVVWIAGGLAKGATFDQLILERADRIRAVVLIGVDQDELLGALNRHAAHLPIVRIDPGDTGTVMSRAVNAAVDLARPGDTVLLAPACASMDQFDSYAVRGEAFAAAARGLAGRPSRGR